MDKIRAYLSNLARKMQSGMVRMMMGRRGPDELTLALLWLGIILTFLSGFTGWGIFMLLGYAAEIWRVFRMFSRNIPARAKENTWYVTKWNTVKRGTKAFFLRIKLRKQYKYFRCPGCKSRMRLSRGRGEVEMTCPKCHTVFKQKA